jgi:septal ring factor EnvC (AmiA/AmiB activator)
VARRGRVQSADHLHAQELQHQLQSQISSLETERDELYEEVYIINEELRVLAKENMDLDALLKDSQVKINSLKAEVESTEKEKNNLMMLRQQERDDLAEQLTYYKNLDMERQAIIKVKESEITDIKGLEHLNDLKTLDLGQNSISKIQGLDKLKNLSA